MKKPSRDLTRRDALKACTALTLGAALSAHPASAATPATIAADSPLAGNGLHHILRIYLPLEVAPQRTTEVLDYCRRTGCREVLLFTTSYDQTPSFQRLDEIEGYVTAIRPQAERLRAAGITVSVNVLQTLGHVYFPNALQEQFPFQRRVASDGHTSAEGACPLGRELRAWAARAYAIYAQLRPPVLFVDDDYRTMMAGGMYCFCPLHLRRLTATAGLARTASEVHNYRRDFVAPALLLTENQRGERFGVLAFSGKGDRHLLENLMRPEQLRNALGWIARRPLPVCTHHDAPYLWPIVNRTADGRLVIGLINLATDSYDALPLVFDRQLVPRRLMIITPEGRLAPALTSAPETRAEQTCRLVLHHRLEPFEVGVFVAE